MSLLSVLFHLQNRVSGFWNFNFQPRYLGKRSLCLWNQPHFKRNSDKSLVSPKQNSLKEIWDTVLKDNNAKIKVFPNIPCTFLLVKATVFLQIFFPKNLLFQQVLRTSVFLNSKCLKTSNKRTHISLFINQFVSLIFNWTRCSDW